MLALREKRSWKFRPKLSEKPWRMRSAIDFPTTQVVLLVLPYAMTVLRLRTPVICQRNWQLRPSNSHINSSGMPYNHTTTQVHHTTSMHPSKAKRLKKFLSVVGEKGANLKTLMEKMNLRNRSSFVNAYITPNLTEGHIAMLYPESPNHPMQSYYLTNKGREVLNSLWLQIRLVTIWRLSNSAHKYVWGRRKMQKEDCGGLICWFLCAFAWCVWT